MIYTCLDDGQLNISIIIWNKPILRLSIVVIIKLATIILLVHEYQHFTFDWFYILFSRIFH